MVFGWCTYYCRLAVARWRCLLHSRKFFLGWCSTPRRCCSLQGPVPNLLEYSYSNIDMHLECDISLIWCVEAHPFSVHCIRPSWVSLIFVILWVLIQVCVENVVNVSTFETCNLVVTRMKLWFNFIIPLHVVSLNFAPAGMSISRM